MQVDRPDDPSWLTREPDIRLVDLQVLRQAGIPEPLLFLALREARTAGKPARRPLSVGHCGGADLSYLDEITEDPDQRPYTWDLPEDDI